MESSEQNQPFSRKRKILIVEDNELNRDILEAMLGDEFELLSAENGAEGIRMLKKHREELSLVLLDVYMPVLNGFEFLQQTQADPFLAAVPVIIATGSDKREDEERCLRLGATDFITKPYQPEILLSRVRNIVRYRESLTTLSVVEYDPETGLYTMPAFYHHGEQLLTETGESRDMVVWQLRDFQSLHSVLGERKSGEILKYMGDSLKKTFPEGLIARQDASFYLLEPASCRLEPDQLRAYNLHLGQNGPIPGIRILTGLYQNVPADQPMQELCDRTSLAVRYADGDDSGLVWYDESLENRCLQERSMILGFSEALEHHDFVIRIQPKVDSLTGAIVAAEALVRWIGPDGRMISPAVFIPLLEREDMIARLDEYVFRTVCEYQRSQLDQGLRVVPVSINLSRVSLYRKGIVERYRSIAEEEQVELPLVPLEITESAVASDLHLTQVSEAFAAAGFVLHMDDFGSGYSSMSQLATLPFSVLKIDKSITDRIGSRKGSIVAESVIEAAHALNLEIVAEGVEQAEQAQVLEWLGCHVIQGYYYAAPVTPGKFTELMQEERPYADRTVRGKNADGIPHIGDAEFKRYLKACRVLFSVVRIVDPEKNRYRIVAEDGTPGEEQENCFRFWKRTEPCAVCTSLMAARNRKTEYKFEALDGEVYLTYAVCIEVDGVPRVIELINPVGDGLLRGSDADRTMIDLITPSDTKQNTGV